MTELHDAIVTRFFAAASKKRVNITAYVQGGSTLTLPALKEDNLENHRKAAKEMYDHCHNREINEEDLIGANFGDDYVWVPKIAVPEY